MHELSLVAGLFEILEEKAREQGALAVTMVKVKVGRLSGIVPDLLESAFEIFKKGTIAETARLEVETVPYKLRCQACGADSFREDTLFVCSSCGSTDLLIVEGRDLVLEKIEVEI